MGAVIDRTFALKAIFAEVKMPPKSPVTQAPKRFRRPDQRQYAALVKRTGKRLDKLATHLASGRINLSEFELHAREVLLEGHHLAAAAGRRRAGDPALTVGVDALRASHAMQTEGSYFTAFCKQIQEGDPRYTDEAGNYLADPIASRSRNYLGRLRGTANDAFVESSPVGILFDWVMLVAEHCDVCPSRQEASPYMAETLPGKPGDGSTPCRHNCRCVLVRHDGIVGFAPVGWSKPDLKPGSVGNTGDIPIIDLDLNNPADVALLQEYFVGGAIPTV